MITIMLITADAGLQIAMIFLGMQFALFGAIFVCVSFLCANGKIKPNGAVGIRLNLSRNYRLYTQEKYWYEINRYRGKRLLLVAIAWVLLSIAVILLPLDSGIKMGLNVVVIVLVLAVAILAMRQIYRYADRLVSQDKQYIQKS